MPDNQLTAGILGPALDTLDTGVFLDCWVDWYLDGPVESVNSYGSAVLVSRRILSSEMEKQD